MGADMLIYGLWIHDDKKPDWEAAEKAAKALRWGKAGDGLPEYAADGLVASILEGQHEDGPEAEAALQKLVTDHLAILRQGIDKYGTREGLRELALSSHEGWLVYLTGGMSWGDRPTDLSETFDILTELEIVHAAGFNQDSNAVMVSL